MAIPAAIAKAGLRSVDDVDLFELNEAFASQATYCATKLGLDAEKVIAAISGGAALGANARWLLGLWLNALFPALPLGTLAANLLGGWLIGLALGVFAWLPALAPEWRLFLVTGFLGALTTFSTFSAEMFEHLQSGRWAVALAGIAVHVAGSLAMTGLGFAMVALVRDRL